jgi:hypothetical protein
MTRSVKNRLLVELNYILMLHSYEPDMKKNFSYQICVERSTNFMRSYLKLLSFWDAPPRRFAANVLPTEAA